MAWYYWLLIAVGVLYFSPGIILVMVSLIKEYVIRRGEGHEFGFASAMVLSIFVILGWPWIVKDPRF